MDPLLGFGLITAGTKLIEGIFSGVGNIIKDEKTSRTDRARAERLKGSMERTKAAFKQGRLGFEEMLKALDADVAQLKGEMKVAITDQINLGVETIQADYDDWLVQYEHNIKAARVNMNEQQKAVADRNLDQVHQIRSQMNEYRQKAHADMVKRRMHGGGYGQVMGKMSGQHRKAEDKMTKRQMAQDERFAQARSQFEQQGLITRGTRARQMEQAKKGVRGAGMTALAQGYLGLGKEQMRGRQNIMGRRQQYDIGAFRELEAMGQMQANLEESGTADPGGAFWGGAMPGVGQAAGAAAGGWMEHMLAKDGG